jgi:hypothetical protein
MPVSPSVDRKALHAILDELLDERARVESMPPDEQRDWSGVLARSMLAFAARACGPGALINAYGPQPEGDDRAARLDALSARLDVVAHFFASCSSVGTADSIECAAHEVHLIASGDKPTIFAQLAKRKGRRSNAAALAFYQLRALEWEARLDELGMPAAERQSLVASAYGQTWEAIVKWKGPLASALGVDAFAYRLAVARRESRAFADTFGTGVAIDDIERDGAAYIRALGHNS